jgi:periplasmic divalent cation tolerance protein
MKPPALLVWTSCPDAATAGRIADALIEQHLAACVNCLAPMTSVYRWKGAVERATEIPLVIKTTSVRLAEVEEAIRALHPYELPEIIAISIDSGDARYLRWIEDETHSQT